MQDQPDTQDVDVDPSLLQETQPDIIDNGDDTSTVMLDSQQPPANQNDDFLANLAETIDDSILDNLAQKYLSLIEIDLQSREERDKQQADGLKKTGIAEPAPGGANFDGASRATHPALLEGAIDFAAQSIKELYPPNGPVRTQIEGMPNREKTDRAQRKAAFMNWQLENEIRDYRPELEKLLTQLPFGGTQFMKLFWAEDKGRIDVEFVPIDNFILPYNAKGFHGCQRKFHRMELSPLEIDRRERAGEYRDWTLPPSVGVQFSETETQKQIAKIEGKGDNNSQDDNDRIVFEGVIYDEISGDEKAPNRPVPYLITIDKETRKILALYRDWEESDPKCAEIDYLVDFNFIPWRGALAIGLPQLIGGLSDACTGALRALLDSALIANSATCIKLKGTPSGNNNVIEMTQATEIDSMGQDDIRKIAMPLPFPPPSPVLFQLLGFLTTAAKSVISTAEEKIAEASNNMPVGTALALIEQGAKVFSSIHARLHDSQRRCLEIIHRLNREHLNGRIQFGSDPQDYVTQQDFDGPMDVHPVSDPNIFSETQRFAQTQAVSQMLIQWAGTPIAPQVMGMWNLHALFKRSLEQMKFPDYQEVLPDAPVAVPANPCDENVDLVLGKPVKAFPGQDHQAHIQVHADFMGNQFFGMSPAVPPNFHVNALNHIQDHLLNFYQELMKQDAGLSGTDDPNADNSPQISEKLAQASTVVLQAVNMAFGKIPSLMQQTAAHIKQTQPKPPQDPMVGVAMAEVQSKHAIAQGQLQVDQQKGAMDARTKFMDAQQKATSAQQEYDLELRKLGIGAQTELTTTDMKARADLEKAAGDNQAAKEIAAMKIASDHATRLVDGASLAGGQKG